MVLGADERDHLRELVDEARRARLRGERVGYCARCGAPWWTRTPGCGACQRRHHYRATRSVNGTSLSKPTTAAADAVPRGTGRSRAVARRVRNGDWRERA